MYLLYNMN